MARPKKTAFETCPVPDCKHPVKTKGLSRNHYVKALRMGLKGPPWSKADLQTLAKDGRVVAGVARVAATKGKVAERVAKLKAKHREYRTTVEDEIHQLKKRVAALERKPADNVKQALKEERAQNLKLAQNNEVPAGDLGPPPEVNGAVGLETPGQDDLDL